MRYFRGEPIGPVRDDVIRGWRSFTRRLRARGARYAKTELSGPGLAVWFGDLLCSISYERVVNQYGFSHHEFRVHAVLEPGRENPYLEVPGDWLLSGMPLLKLDELEECVDRLSVMLVMNS